MSVGRNFQKYETLPFLQLQQSFRLWYLLLVTVFSTLFSLSLFPSFAALSSSFQQENYV